MIINSDNQLLSLFQLYFNIQSISIGVKLQNYQTVCQNVVNIIDIFILNHFCLFLDDYLANNNLNSSLKILNYCSEEVAREDEAIISLYPTTKNVFGFLIDACIVVLSNINTDNAIGNIIILSQFEWPYYRWAFKKSLKSIRDKIEQHRDNTNDDVLFSYPLFAKYMVNIDIIEHFKELSDLYEFVCVLEPNQICKTRKEMVQCLTKIMNQNVQFGPFQMNFQLLLEFLYDVIKCEFVHLAMTI